MPYSANLPFPHSVHEVEDEGGLVQHAPEASRGWSQRAVIPVSCAAYELDLSRCCAFQRVREARGNDCNLEPKLELSMQVLTRLRIPTFLISGRTSVSVLACVLPDRYLGARRLQWPEHLRF